MGLEPTTFCMASAGGRSCRFASVRSTARLQRFPFVRENAIEPERTPSVANVAIVLVATTSQAPTCTIHSVGMEPLSSLQIERQLRQAQEAEGRPSGQPFVF